jgi:hypothetical protein
MLLALKSSLKPLTPGTGANISQPSDPDLPSVVAIVLVRMQTLWRRQKSRPAGCLGAIY